jgi:hypothetical protein
MGLSTTINTINTMMHELMEEGGMTKIRSIESIQAFRAKYPVFEEVLSPQGRKMTVAYSVEAQRIDMLLAYCMLVHSKVFGIIQNLTGDAENLDEQYQIDYETASTEIERHFDSKRLGQPTKTRWWWKEDKPPVRRTNAEYLAQAERAKEVARMSLGDAAFLKSVLEDIIDKSAFFDDALKTLCVTADLYDSTARGFAGCTDVLSKITTCISSDEAKKRDLTEPRRMLDTVLLPLKITQENEQRIFDKVADTKLIIDVRMKYDSILKDMDWVVNKARSGGAISTKTADLVYHTIFGGHSQKANEVETAGRPNKEMEREMEMEAVAICEFQREREIDGEALAPPRMREAP